MNRKPNAIIPKRHLETAMRIICNFYANQQKSVGIGIDYLHYHGLTQKYDACHIIDVLCSMGYITYKSEQGHFIIRLTDSGKCYFEKKAERQSEKRIEWIRYIITTIIALAAFIKSFFF